MNLTPNYPDSFPLLNISAKIPRIDSTKHKSSSRDSSLVLLDQVVAIKAYFMNKILELKNEICCLKNQLEDGEKDSIVRRIVFHYNYFINQKFLY